MGVTASRYPWWLEPASWIAAHVVRLLGSTWRVREWNAPEYDAAMRDGELVLYAFWHARMLPLVYTHRGRGIAVLVSQHRDGQLIARVIERLGFVTARGSSTRGGDIGLRELLRRAREKRILGITPDGPRGPAEEMKDGLVFLAAHLKWRVVPIGSAASSEWVLRSWDRFRIPKPFARVWVGHAAPITVAGRAGEPGAGPADLARAISELAADLVRRAEEPA